MAIDIVDELELIDVKLYKESHETERCRRAKRAHNAPALAQCELYAPLTAAVGEGITDRISRRNVGLQDGRIVVIAEARLLKAVYQARLVHVGNGPRKDVRDLDVDCRKAPELL